MHTQSEADGLARWQFQCRRLRRGQLLHDGRRRGVVPDEKVEAIVGARPVGDAIAAEPLGVGSKLDDHPRRAQGPGVRLDGEAEVKISDLGRDEHVPIAVVDGIAAPDRFAGIELLVLQFVDGRRLFAIGVAVEVFLVDERCRGGRIAKTQPRHRHQERDPDRSPDDTTHKIESLKPSLHRREPLRRSSYQRGLAQGTQPHCRLIVWRDCGPGLPAPASGAPGSR